MVKAKQPDSIFVQRQVARLEALAGFSAKDLIRRDIAICLAEWCSGERKDHHGRLSTPDEQVEGVISYAIRNLRYWRSPSDLRDIHDSIYPMGMFSAELGEMSASKRARRLPGRRTRG